MTLSYHQRLGVLLVLAACAVLALVGQLFRLQVLEREEWDAVALKLVTRGVPVRGHRGTIRDADGYALARDAPAFELALIPAYWDSRLHECSVCGRRVSVHEAPAQCLRCRAKHSMHALEQRNLEPVARLLRTDPFDLEANIIDTLGGTQRRIDRGVKRAVAGKPRRGDPVLRTPQEVRDYRYDHTHRPVVLRRNVPYEVAREVELHPERNQGLRILSSASRVYPGGMPFVHLVGRAADKRRSLLEQRFNDVLTGKPGRVSLGRDAETGAYTRVVAERPAVPGQPLQLTIARRDQEAAFGVIDGARGAIVVVDSETGAVLAMASAPAYDPDRDRETAVLWSLQGKPERERLGLKQNESPLHERAWRYKDYTGSIIKPIGALAFLEAGSVTPDETIRCERLFEHNGRKLLTYFKCHTAHGPLDLETALYKSCNIYFQTAILRPDAFKRFVEMGRRLGLGQNTGLELEAQTEAWGDWPADPMQWRATMKIPSASGQGDIRATPAQIARAYAGLQTGSLPSLRIVARVGERPTRPEARSLDCRPRKLELIRNALHKAVQPGGSASGYGLQRWGLHCKTGTAKTRETGLHSAWIAGFAPRRGRRPPVAFALVIQGTPLSGAKECGPRLARFLHAFYGGDTE